MPIEGRWFDIRPGALEGEIWRIKYDIKVRFLLATHIGRVAGGGVCVLTVCWGAGGGETGEVDI